MGWGGGGSLQATGNLPQLFWGKKTAQIEAPSPYLHPD